MPKNQFIQELDEDLNDVFFSLDEFGVSMTYTPNSTGVPIQVQGLFDELENPVNAGMEQRFVSKEIIVMIREVDIPGERPKKNDEIEYEGQSYRVIDDVGDRFGVIEVRVHRID